MTFRSDFQDAIKRQNIRGRCLHFSNGERCNEIVAAHSIQKKGQLSLIAENGHVYRLSADRSTLRKTGGVPALKKIGLNNASTFLGFCKYHDNAFFEKIDKFTLNPRKELLALYAYRALCREYFVKENAVEVLTNVEVHNELNSSQQESLAASRLGHCLGFARLQHHKSIFDDEFAAGNFDNFEFTYFTSQSPCPVQLAGVLYPDQDFEGNHLQDLADYKTPLDLIAFFTAPTDDGWAFGFAWHVSSSQTCVPLLKSLAERVATDDKLEDALLRFSLSCCENHAVRVSWWDGLSESSKAAAIERMRMMMHPLTPVPDHYLAAGCEGIANWKYEHVHTTVHATA